MSKKEIEILNNAEISQVHGGAGELSARYLALKAEDTKTGGEIAAAYLSLTSEGTKNAN